MIQDDAKKLLEKIVVPFDNAHREKIFTEIHQFATTGDNKAKLMGAMLKAYLEREWQFGRTPELATLQKFVGGDFKVDALPEHCWQQPTWNAQPPLCADDNTLYNKYGGPEQYQKHGSWVFKITDLLHEDAESLTVRMDDGLRNILMLHRVVRDALERKEQWGQEGSRMANSMAVLLFDDASYPLPKARDRNGADYCTLHGQELLAKHIRESGYNPFAELSIAEVGGIKNSEDKRLGLGSAERRDYYTITLAECPVTGLFKKYKNVGGEEWTSMGKGAPLNLATQKKIFGNEKFDYFVSNWVVSKGSGSHSDYYAEKDVHEERAHRELLAAGMNILNKGGANLHMGADIMPEVSRRGKIWPFMGCETVNGMHVKQANRVITPDALAAFETGKTWEEFSGRKVPFAEQVGGKQQPEERGKGNSRKTRPRNE